MPLFSSKFSAKTIPVRKQDTSVIKNEFGSDYAAKELSLDVGPLTLKLGDFEISFDEGHWIPEKLSLFRRYKADGVADVHAESQCLLLINKALDKEVLTSGKAGAAHKENLKLKKELERLEEENNMLRLKFEILLDMMTDKTVEAEQQELQRAQSMGSLKPKSKKQKW